MTLKLKNDVFAGCSTLSGAAIFHPFRHILPNLIFRQSVQATSHFCVCTVAGCCADFLGLDFHQRWQKPEICAV
jgi:ABC-type dipeptide/oligopeptide/nickel transport system permease subunit